MARTTKVNCASIWVGVREEALVQAIRAHQEQMPGEWDPRPGSGSPQVLFVSCVKSSLFTSPGGAEPVPVTQNSSTPNTAPPCLPQASSLYSTGANVLTQNSCWGQIHRHLKCTPWCHTARHAPPWMCPGAVFSSGWTQPCSGIYCHTCLTMQGQRWQTSRHRSQRVISEQFTTLLNSTSMNNASLCNGNEYLKTSLDAVFSLVKYLPPI